ncbi:MAG: hypothetical protein DRJ97_07240 [Thermoprotei archaeon]|nr:MAG: hypothetical protein DRJ97_07240 [Thermoprotei archaeon]
MRKGRNYRPLCGTKLTGKRGRAKSTSGVKRGNLTLKVPVTCDVYLGDDDWPINQQGELILYEELVIPSVERWSVSRLFIKPYEVVELGCRKASLGLR